MKLTLAEPKYLKDSISIISDLVSEARFKITKNAIELTAIDPANVAMVIFRLLSSNFVEYNVEKEMNIGINLNNLKQVLRRANQNDMLSIEISADNKLKITLKGKTVRVFSLPLIEMEEKEQKIPDLKFPITIKTKSSNLTSAIEDADIVAEAITFIGDANSFAIKAEGDLSKAEIEIGDSETEIKLDESKVIRAKYSIEYLKKMMQGEKISDEVIVQFNSDYPLKLDYKVRDKIQFIFILAPRVEND